MKLLTTICARGGSKGIPGKNIKVINGMPLIAYTIKIAQKFVNRFGGIIALSTESAEIKGVAKEFGLETDYTRPAELAGDTIGKLETIDHLLRHEEQKLGYRFDFILDLDVTSPMRTIEDLLAAFKSLKKDKNALNLFSVNPASRNPYFNMVEKGDSGYYELIKKPESSVLSRQQAPKVYDLNASFYFYRRKFFDLDQQTVLTERSLIYEMPHACFDLDELVDFDYLKFLIENDKLDFKLT